MISKPWPGPCLSESSDLFTIGIGGADPTASMAVLGPGTGLGVACHALNPAGEIVIASEGGHATLPATCRREDAIIEHLRNRFGHVSVERVLSGDGLVNLYEAVAAINHLSAVRRNAASITAGAIEGGCPICREALDYSAQCWVPSPEMSPSLLPRRAASLSPVESRRELLNI